MTDFLQIDRDILLAINGCGGEFVDELMLILTNGLTWIPLYVALLYVVVRNAGSSFANARHGILQTTLFIVAALLCVVLAGGLSDMIVKPLVERVRPCNDEVLLSALRLIIDDKPAGYSFYSSHAANTFSVATLFALIIRSRVLNGVLFAWTLINCFSRMYLAAHYPSDVVVGMAWGALVAVVIYLLCGRIAVRNGFERSSITIRRRYVTGRYTSSGFAKRDIFVVVAVFVLTLIYASTRAFMAT